MVDEFGARLSASSPPVTASSSIAAEVTALALATQGVASRPRPRLLRFGIPVLAGLLVLGGAGAAFAAPSVQRSLGLVATTPSTSATPAPALALPFPNCRVTFVVTSGSTSPENAADVASLAAAQQYLDSFDQARLLASSSFIARYGHPVSAADGNAKSQALSQLSDELAATEERAGISSAALSGVDRYLRSQGLTQTAMSITGGSSSCGQDQ
jgi:hypothetical protein